MIKKLLENKWRTLLILYILFIIHGTSLPYDFTMDKDIILKNIHRLFQFYGGDSLFYRQSSSDIIANIFFFIPFGFLLTIVYFKQSIKTKGLFLLKVGIAGFILSAFVETVQLFTLIRNSSFSDLLTNTLGTLFGAVIGTSFLKQGYREKTLRLIRYLLNDPALFLLLSYMGGIILIGLLPFDFNISLISLSKKIQGLLKIEYRPISRPAALFNLIFLYGSGGYIFMRFAQLKWKNLNWKKAFILSVSAGSAFCFGVEILQIFVRSRYFNWTDVLVGTLGILYGALSYSLLHSQQLKERLTENRHNFVIFTFFVINYFLFLIYKYLFPFTLNSENIFVFNKVQFFLTNMFSYVPSQRISELMVILLKNIALFIPSGIILAESKFIDFNRDRFVSFYIPLLFIVKSLQIINLQQTLLLFDFLGILVGMIGGYFTWLNFRQFILIRE
ncbi:MAG TPA: VanZ family protein [Calditrichaeota bacterium]|nr:VanZ family protein [Calditrichota bacterium]